MGVREEESLLAAIERPWQASFGREHFASSCEKTATLMESIMWRHPFVDGNKRSATASASCLLSTFVYGVEAEQQGLADFAGSVAVGGLKTKDIAHWFENQARKT